MSAIESTFYTSTYYVFGSPRYNAVKNYPTNVIPEDYIAHDAVNGTADKFFPCYTLTENDKPVTELVNNKGDIYQQKGAFAFREHRTGFQEDIVGSKDSTNALANKNLNKYKISKDKYVTAKLNPGWCVIQTALKPPKNPDDKIKYIPQFVVRALGNNDSIKELYAVDLDDESNKLYSSNTDFLAGEIVLFKKRLFKCTRNTKEYPPEAAKDTTFWQYMNFDRNVFNADLFVMSNTTARYFLHITDDKRNFDPKRETDDTLVCWSVAYYHS